jgi:hypothetical protein
MYRRTLPFIVLLLLPTLGPAAEPAEKPPTLVLRVASLDSLCDFLKLLGTEDIGKQLRDSFKGKGGPKGLVGIDGKRPLGLYARFGTDLSDINAILMVPVTGAKEFRDTLEGMGWEVKSNKDGLNTVKQNLWPVDVQYRVANGYAYLVLLGTEPLKADDLPAPAKIFAPETKAAVSLTVRIDQLPPGGREMVLEVLKSGLARSGGREETKAQKAKREAFAKEVVPLMEMAFKDGEEANAQLDIDPNTKELNVELTVSARAKSAFADRLAKFGQREMLLNVGDEAGLRITLEGGAVLHVRCTMPLSGLLMPGQSK